MLVRRTPRGSCIALVAGLLIVASAGPAVATAGDLDASFSRDGKVRTDFGAADEATSVDIAPHGSIVVVGVSSGEFAVSRYTPDGTLDPHFGGDGTVTTALGSVDAFASDVTIQTDGRIVVVGGGSRKFLVVRYRRGGSLDPTFGGNGIVRIDFGGPGSASAVAVQANGKIVAAGAALNPTTDNEDFSLVRLLPDGSLDRSFGGDGRVRTDFGAADVAAGMAIQSDGKIVVAGGTFRDFPESDFALARYLQDGRLDATFGRDGRKVTSFDSADSARSVAIQSDGKIVAAGHAPVGGQQGFALARYDTGGTLDRAFGGDGTVTTPFGAEDAGATGLAIHGAGVVAVGSGSEAERGGFALVRYERDGSLDSAFGGDGKVITSFGVNGGGASDVAIQPDGRIVVAGCTSCSRRGSDFALARYVGF